MEEKRIPNAEEIKSKAIIHALELDFSQNKAIKLIDTALMQMFEHGLISYEFNVSSMHEEDYNVHNNYKDTWVNYLNEAKYYCLLKGLHFEYDKWEQNIAKCKLSII